MYLAECLQLIQDRGEKVRFQFPNKIITNRHVYITCPQNSWDRELRWYTAYEI